MGLAKFGHRRHLTLAARRLREAVQRDEVTILFTLYYMLLSFTILQSDIIQYE